MNCDKSSIIIEGGQNLMGQIFVSGSKNSSLPILASTLLINGNVTVNNVPRIDDVHDLISMLKLLNVNVNFTNNSVQICDKKAQIADLPHYLTNKIRASSLLIGPLLTRFRKLKIACPGGCNIGSRAIDMHIMGLTKMGAEFTIDNNFIIAKTEHRLKGTEIKFDKISVGATQNIIMAATLAKGKTIIHGTSIEPEVTDLINFLNQSGANIKFIDERVISVTGVESLKSTSYTVISDRVEAATYILATIATKGELTLHNINIEHLQNVLTILNDLFQIKIESPSKNCLYIKYLGRKKTKINVETSPYPGFPTDLQAQLMVLFTQLDGSFKIIENVFDGRFMHVHELIKMGAKIKITNNIALIDGPSELVGTKVNATDLRASVALLIAGMIAKGKTIIQNSNYIHRGYENIQKKLENCSVKIELMHYKNSNIYNQLILND